jgi:hypothetical protein
VNYCAWYYGYYPGVSGDLYQSRSGTHVSADPPLTAEDPFRVEYIGSIAEAHTTASSSADDLYDLFSIHIVEIDVEFAIPVYGGYTFYDPLGMSHFSSTTSQGTAPPSDSYYPPYYEYYSVSQRLLLGFTTTSGSAGDKTPSITSVSPNVWTPGTLVPFQIDGRNFGTAPIVQIEPSDGITVVNATSELDGTRISGSVSVRSEADPGQRVVRVRSQGAIGSGFIPAPGSVATSNGKTVTIGNPSCTVSLTNDGQVYILNTNEYRQASIPLLATSNCAGTVKWSLEFEYSAANDHGAFYVALPPVTSALNSQVELTTPLSIGGRAHVIALVTINGKSTSVAGDLHVQGTRLPEALVTSYIASKYSGPTTNLFTGIASVESHYAEASPNAAFTGQFSRKRYTVCPAGGLTDLLPQGSTVNGFWPTENCNGQYVGLMNTAINTYNTFDWKRNVDDGINLFMTDKLAKANTDEAKAIAACQQRMNRKLPQLTGRQKEDNMVNYYRWGSMPYWVPEASCTRWIKNPVVRYTVYTDEIRRNLR